MREQAMIPAAVLLRRVPLLVSTVLGLSILGCGDAHPLKRAASQSSTLTLMLPSQVPLHFVLIEPGSVVIPLSDTMGTRRIEITVPLYMSCFEITQEQWQAVMHSNPSFFKGPRLPVEQVNWHDCIEFCDRATSSTGRKVQLPTEAEWLYAFLSGVRDANSTVARASEGGDEVVSTRPVGSRAPSRLGLFDMERNVREWCCDWLHVERTVSSGRRRVFVMPYRRICGDSWRGGGGGPKIAGTQFNDPVHRADDLGLRVVLGGDSETRAHLVEERLPRWLTEPRSITNMTTLELTPSQPIRDIGGTRIRLLTIDMQEASVKLQVEMDENREDYTLKRGEYAGDTQAIQVGDVAADRVTIIVRWSE